MSYNKWFPHRAEEAPRRLTPVARAWLLRGAWYVSLAMMGLGYVLLFVFWDG